MCDREIDERERENEREREGKRLYALLPLRLEEVQLRRASHSSMINGRLAMR